MWFWYRSVIAEPPHSWSGGSGVGCIVAQGGRACSGRREAGAWRPEVGGRVGLSKWAGLIHNTCGRAGSPPCASEHVARGTLRASKPVPWDPAAAFYVTPAATFRGQEHVAQPSPAVRRRQFLRTTRSDMKRLAITLGAAYPRRALWRGLSARAMSGARRNASPNRKVPSRHNACHSVSMSQIRRAVGAVEESPEETARCARARSNSTLRPKSEKCRTDITHLPAREREPECPSLRATRRFQRPHQRLAPAAARKL